MFAVSGHVNRPGVFEVPNGITTFRELFDAPEYCDGVRAGRRLKAFVPGGVSAPWFFEEHLDLPLDKPTVDKAGSMLLGVDRSEDLHVEPFKVQRPVAVVIGLAIIGLVGTAVLTGAGTNSRAITGEKSLGGTLSGTEPNINKLARSLFSTYVFAFEVTSILLIVAVLATVILARRPFRIERAEREERAQEKAREEVRS